MTDSSIFTSCFELLQRLIATPAFSREEDKRADLMQDFLEQQSLEVHRKKNNVWTSFEYNSTKPTVLLNSHLDTVKPASGYTRDPFSPDIEDGKLYGLGSNDAGGALVTLLAAFLHAKATNDLPYNLVFAASAEEEISGKNGMEYLVSQLPKIDFAIVGEPTQMQMAIAEKGLMVLDCIAPGVSGHAAREEGENAIYKALEDIEWFRSYAFDQQSDTLGSVKMSVTQIEAGSQHNVVPDQCSFVVDVRVTDAYTLEEVLDIIRANVSCEVKPRSVRLRSSGLPQNHPILKVAQELNISTFGSSTMSDQALMPFPSVKIGPGNSARSHTADEFIGVDEMKEAVAIYTKILQHLTLTHYETMG